MEDNRGFLLSGPKSEGLGSYSTISIWLGSFTSMYGPFSLRITTPRTRIVLPLKWAVGSSMPASANFARPLSVTTTPRFFGSR